MVVLSPPQNLSKASIWQVAIVLFRTLEEFYDAPLKFITLPLIIWRFVTIGIGSLLTGGSFGCMTGSLH